MKIISDNSHKICDESKIKFSRDYQNEIKNLLNSILIYANQKPSLDNKIDTEHDFEHVGSFYINQFLDIYNAFINEIMKNYNEEP